MVNLVKYFSDNYDKNKYPYYNKILKEYNIDKLKSYSYEEYIDDEEIIEKWKAHTYPVSVATCTRDDYEKEIFEFILISFYLLNEGFKIKEHPDLLRRINWPGSISEKFKEETRSKIGEESNGIIRWNNRKRYSDSLTFIKKNNGITYSTNIQEIFKLVSPSNKDFRDMPVDEKLAQIKNVIAYIGKKDKKYIDLEIDELSNYITKNQIKNYTNWLHCFRHGEKEMVGKRDQYTEQQKMFLIDYGLMVINAIERHVDKKDNA